MTNEFVQELDLRTASAEEVNRVMTEGAHAALRAHRAAGQSVVVWRDGQIVEIPAEQVELLPDILNTVHES